MGWAVRVCKRIRFIEGVKGYTYVGLVVVCYVMFFFFCFVAPILYWGIVKCGYLGELVGEKMQWATRRAKQHPACSLPIFLANLNLSNPSKKES